jgi:hypothetical protein
MLVVSVYGSIFGSQLALSCKSQKMQKGGQKRWTAPSTDGMSNNSREAAQATATAAFPDVVEDQNSYPVYGLHTPGDAHPLSTFSNQTLTVHVRDDLLDDERSYLLKLYDRTMPVQSSIFGPSNPCLRWTGALDRDGYARHRIPNRIQQTGLSNVVSRFVFQLAYGIPPEQDWTVDHACGNKACINLSHLRLLPRALNVKLGDPRRGD